MARAARYWRGSRAGETPGRLRGRRRPRARPGLGSRQPVERLSAARQLVPFLHETVRYLAVSTRAPRTTSSAPRPPACRERPGVHSGSGRSGSSPRRVTVNVDPEKATGPPVGGRIPGRRHPVEGTRPRRADRGAAAGRRQHLWQYALALMILALAAEGSRGGKNVMRMLRGGFSRATVRQNGQLRAIRELLDRVRRRWRTLRVFYVTVRAALAASLIVLARGARVALHPGSAACPRDHRSPAARGSSPVASVGNPAATTGPDDRHVARFIEERAPVAGRSARSAP